MQVLNSMRKKFPMSIARIILKASGLPVKRGWDETIQTVSTMMHDEDFPEREAECLDGYAEALLCMNKAVRIYEVDERVMPQVLRVVNDLEVEEGLFAERYPYCLTTQELLDEEAGNLVLANIEYWEHGAALVYCSKAYSEERERYERDDFNAEIADVFGGADEIIAIRREALQLFHVIWVSADTNIIEVRVDAPKEISTEYVNSIHRRLVDKFNSLVGVIALSQIVNVFPAIKNIYEASGEGAVVNMDFTTQTGSTKNEKMRKSGLDLREELFHCGGCRAVDNQIDPFRISVRWDRQHQGYLNRPEISLNSNFRTSLAEYPGLYEFTASNAHCVDDYDFLVSKVIEYK